jgi:translation initiation factor IF-3
LLQPDETGVMKRHEALLKAERIGLDLVEVSPNAEPPVVRVMDYGKFIFEEKKTKKKQRIQKLKEIKLRPVTDEGDYQVKLRNLITFLNEGDKVKITLRFRGREITHQDLGMKIMDRLREDTKDVGIVDQMPRLEGKQMVMMLSPKKAKA